MNKKDVMKLCNEMHQEIKNYFLPRVPNLSWLKGDRPHQLGYQRSTNLDGQPRKMRTVIPKPGQYFVHCPVEGCEFNCVASARAIQLLPLLDDKESLTPTELQDASSYINFNTYWTAKAGFKDGINLGGGNQSILNKVSSHVRDMASTDDQK